MRERTSLLAVKSFILLARFGTKAQKIVCCAK